jgi:hypothetical protein
MAEAPSTRGNDPGAAEVRLNRLLDMILESAVEALGFDAATITARQGDDVATVAATDQRLVELDESQYETGEGPCLSVLEPGDPIPLPDAGEEDDRWEHFSRTAAHLGIHSSLSMHLPVDEAEELQASLNLYSRRRLELSEEQIQTAVPFAQQLAAVMLSVDANRSTAKMAHDMAEAMRSRAVIEQAKGILMADDQISPDDAFDRLVQLSQKANLKLRDVAQRLVDERSNPPHN